MDLAQVPSLRNAVFFSPWQIPITELGPFAPGINVLGSGYSGTTYRTTYRRETVRLCLLGRNRDSFLRVAANRFTCVSCSMAQVALKVVNNVNTLRRELQLHSRVRDLNVVTLWGTTTLATGQPALILEYCDLGNLRNSLGVGGAGATWSAAQRLSLCLDVAWGECGCNCDTPPALHVSKAATDSQPPRISLTRGSSCPRHGPRAPRGHCTLRLEGNQRARHQDRRAAPRKGPCLAIYTKRYTCRHDHPR